MTELQVQMLEMLKWFHEFCVAHDLRYYAIYGTALGAIRHKGFIPWDDDMDVGMPRQEYDRFYELAAKEINGKTPYFAESISNSSEYVIPYGKLYDTRTTLIENARHKLTRGVFLDIFPLDGMGNDLSTCGTRANTLHLLNIAFAMKACALNKRRKFYKNAAIVCASLIPDAVISARKIAEKLDRIAREVPFEGCKYVGNIVDFVAWNRVSEREWFGTPTLHPFEDTEIFVPEHYVEYLKNYFGDWESLPPECDRVSNHDFIYLDLEKPYR